MIRAGRAAEVAGHVSDQDGKPLPEVDVRLADVSVASQGRYEAPHEYKVRTDANGNFRFGNVPIGNATIRLHKAGYCRPGLGHAVTTPAKDIVLGMMKSAAIQVTVDFAGMARPSGYIVEMEPDGGAAVGKWSGSGNIDAMNQITFKDVPPGYYEIHGHPNPSRANERTKPLLVELKGGETKTLTIRAH